MNFTTKSKTRHTAADDLNSKTDTYALYSQPWLEPWSRRVSSFTWPLGCGDLCNILSEENLSIGTTPWVLLKVTFFFKEAESTTKRFWGCFKWYTMTELPSSHAWLCLYAWWNPALLSSPCETEDVCSPSLTLKCFPVCPMFSSTHSLHWSLQTPAPLVSVKVLGCLLFINYLFIVLE